MVVVIIFVILLANENVGSVLQASKPPTKVSEESTSEEIFNDYPGLRIETQPYLNGTAGSPIRCSTLHCSYPVPEEVDFIELTCKMNEKGLLNWIDSYGYHVMDNFDPGKGFKLRLRPNELDNNLALTCAAYYDKYNVNITVTLLVSSKNRIKDPDNESVNVTYLENGKPWRCPGNCNGFAYYPTTSTIPNTQTIYKDPVPIFYGNNTVISSFNNTLNGAIFYCNQYHPFHKNPSRDLTYERVTTKFIFLNEEVPLKIKKGTERNFASTEEEIAGAMEESSYKTRESNLDSESINAAILGGVLGTIIIILIALILRVWNKSRQRKPKDDTEVVYEEIEERVNTSLPTPRNTSPYAEITLTPHRAQLKENPNAAVQRQKRLSENLYTVLE